MCKSNILQLPQKMPNNVQIGCGRTKILSAPTHGNKIIVNQSKPILVIVSINPSLVRVSGKIIFHTKLSGQSLLTLPLNRFSRWS